MNSNISKEEMQVRNDLAACYRLFVKFGWTDLIFTHLSARVPNTTDQYLINPYGLLFSEITASNLIKVDFNGDVVSGNFSYNKAGHAIHSSILQARPDANAVLHSHTRAGASVSAMGERLLPLSQHAIEIQDLVCYHPYTYAPDDNSECERLANDIGDKWLMIMHNHGLLGLGRSVAEAFYYLYVLETACKIQVDVLAASSQPIIPDKKAIESLTRHAGIDTEGQKEYITLNWQAMLRNLKSEGINWQA